MNDGFHYFLVCVSLQYEYGLLSPVVYCFVGLLFCFEVLYKGSSLDRIRQTTEYQLQWLGSLPLEWGSCIDSSSRNFQWQLL